MDDLPIFFSEDDTEMQRNGVSSQGHGADCRMGAVNADLGCVMEGHKAVASLLQQCS